MLQMSGKHLHVLPKLFGVNCWIPQMIRQWIPGCCLATENTWVPKVQPQTCGTASWWHLADRRCCQRRISETGTQQSTRYPRARCQIQWWTVTVSLYCTCWRITSWCRSWCISWDRPCSHFQVPVTLTGRDAAFLNTLQLVYDLLWQGKWNSCNSRHAMWQRRGLLSLPSQCPTSDKHISAAIERAVTWS